MQGLSSRLTFVVGCIVLFAVLFVSVCGYVSGRTSIEAQIRERIAVTTRTAASQVDAYVVARAEELRQLSASSLQMTSLSDAERAKVLSEYANAFGSNRYTEIALLDPHGRVRIASAGAPSYASRPELVRALGAAARPGVMPLARFADQTQDVFVVYAPLIDENGRRAGTLVARLQTTELAALVRSIPVDASTSLFLTRGNTTIAANQGAHGPSAPAAPGTLSANAPVAARPELAVAGVVDSAAAFAPVNALALRSALAGLLVLVLAWFATVFTARRLARPLRALAGASTALANGDLRARVDVPRDVRETAELADAFNAMAENLRDLIGGLAETSHAVARTAQETLAGANAVRGESDEQARSAARIAAALGEVAAGARAIGDDAERLERSSREGQEHIGALLGEIDATTAAVEQLRASVEQTNEAGSALSSQALSVAERAREAARRADGATASAHRGGEAVRGLVGDIREVGGSLAETALRLERLAGATSDAIAAQVEVIDDIADRSKLLALNAGIEAARAGVHGRGFAVIAEELHRLASGSKAASDEVKSLVTSVIAESQALLSGARSSRTLAEGAVERANLTGGTIGAMVAEIAEAAAQARAIGGIAAEQAERTGEIGAATEQMRRMAETTARSTAAVNDLSRRVRDAVGIATQVAAQVADATREQRSSFRVIEAGTAEIGAASAHVADAAERSFIAVGTLRTEIDRVADGVARFAGAGADAALSPVAARREDLRPALRPAVLEIA